MVVDILQWTYRKYKIYCFIAFILLGVCILGYIALIAYWVNNLMQASKMRKRQPTPPRPEHTSEPLPGEIMALDNQPVPKIRILEPVRPPRRYEVEIASLSPSPLHRRTQRRRRSKQIFNFDSGQSVANELPNPGHRLRLPSSKETSLPPHHKKVSDRLKDDRSTYKQYIFV